MKKRYKLETGLDTSITLEIDTAKISEDLAREINAFWVEADFILTLSRGDVYQAVARRAAGPLLSYLLDGWHSDGAVASLLADEGIMIVDHDIPCLGADDFAVTELEGA